MIKSNIKTKYAKSFLETIKKEDNYLFIGKVDPWETESTNYIPESPKDSLFEENNAKKSILCAYKIYETDAALGIKREGYDWISGNKYDEYDDRKELNKNNLKYYSINEVNGKLRVYKCLNNNNGGISTDPPISDGTEEEYKNDGYVWKFLYEIPEDMEKFITIKHIPVPVLENLSYLDERSLQLDVQTNAKPGSIEEINFSYKIQSTNNFSIVDIINPTFLNSSCVVLNKQVDTDNNISITIGLSSMENPITLSYENNYYNNNYIMIFETNDGQVIGTIKNYTFVNTDESRAIVELCDIYGGINNISVGSIYSIVPKIQINGDGDNAIAIPIFSSNYELIDVELFSLGTNYTKAEAFFLVESQYDLNPIISPNQGHGLSAYKELCANNVLISKTLSKHTETISGVNKYYFGNGNNIHQFGIINNLKSMDNYPLKVDKELNNITLIKQNSQVSLVFLNYNNNTGDTSNDTSFFNINDILTKGSNFKKDQFRGKINSIFVQNNQTIVICTLLNGLFENYPNSPLKNVTQNKSLNDYDLSEVSVNYINMPDLNLLFNVDTILGNESLFITKVLETTYNDSNNISYKVEKINGNPIPSKYSITGDLIRGENVTLLYQNTDNEFNIIPETYMNIFDINFINSSIDTCYSYITKITINSRNIQFPLEPISENSYIQENNFIDNYIISKDLLNFGRVINVEYINPIYDDSIFQGYAYVDLYIKSEKGIFCDFDQDSDREIFLMNTNPYLYKKTDPLISINGFVSNTGPVYEINSNNLNINSGEILYLENIRYVTLSDDQSIKVNLVLEF